MFEDLIPDKIERMGLVNKDNLIKNMKDDLKLKDDHIMELIDEIVDLRKELDYLRNL